MNATIKDVINMSFVDEPIDDLLLFIIIRLGIEYGIS